MSLTGLQLGQYRLLQQLGSGGMGEVYLAEDERIGQHVAIKVSKTVNSSDYLFKREAKAIASLDHPRILPLFSYGEENVNGTTYTYIVMPHRREGSFTDWLQQRFQRGPLSLQDVAYFIVEAAEALQYAHDHQIVHQDVKPSNFLIRDNPANPDHPDLLLADFGIAKRSDTSTNVSQSVRGTPTYMSPEQWSGTPVPATDQYALAVVAYELLAGRVPFVGRQEQVMYQHLSVQPQPPSSLNRLVSPAVDAVILRALAKQAADRFPSIMSFAQALQQAAQIPATMYAPPPPPVLPPTQISKIERAALPHVPYAQHAQHAPIAPQQGNVYPLASTVQAQQASPIPPSYHPPVYGTPNTPPAHTIGGHQFINRITENNNRVPLPIGRVIILAGVLLLVIIGSVGIFSAVRGQNNANGNSSNTFVQRTQTADHSGNSSQPTHATTNSPATPTVPTTFPFSNRQVLNDSLSSQSASNWFSGSTVSGTCSFTNGVYQANQSGAGFNFCPAQSTNFNNFSYQVQMRFISGECGGLMLRGNPTTGDVYYYKVCSNGRYFFDHIANCINCSQIIKSGSLSGFTITTTNTIGVVATRNHFDLYLNGQRIDSVTDGALSQGVIGVASDSSGSQTTVLFANARVWQL